MLVVTRRTGESVSLCDRDGNVFAIIAVTSVDGGKVRIGIEAGNDVAIFRSEVFERIYSKAPALPESFERMLGNRLPHAATEMKPLPHLIDILHGDAVGRHD